MSLISPKGGAYFFPERSGSSTLFFNPFLIQFFFSVFRILLQNGTLNTS